VRLAVAIAVLAFAAPAWADEVRFRPLHIHIDAGDAAVAAYQIELKVKSGDAKIVGVENGEHRAFAQPPYYDPAALMSGRIILAGLSIADELPTRGRFLTVHVREQGEVEYELKTMVVAGPSGAKLKARIWIEEKKK